MKHLARALTALALTLTPAVALAQLDPVVIEAESGTVGSGFTVASDGSVTPAVNYVAIDSTGGLGSPGTPDRVISYSVTFPHGGVWELYIRVRVGPATFNDDSMLYGNGFGANDVASDADWVLANGLAAPVGFTNPDDKVTGGGTAGSGVWKWVKLSVFDGGEPPPVFDVPAGALTQTFEIAGREDGLWIDKLAFGPEGVFFTVSNLDNGEPGTTEPPPPPFEPTGPPLATGLPKHLGSAWSPPQNEDFEDYWNQVTPENAGKWGSVEGTRDVMNWNQLDTAYNLARSHGFEFRLHTLIWGNQQPAWIESLPTAEQREEIEEWFAEVAARYPDIDQIDVVNEPLHDPPDGPGDGNYIEALGGTGQTGWDWVLEAFRLAREHFPNAKLGLNDFSITNSNNSTTRFLDIIRLLQAEDLIDYIGEQGHAFSTRPNIPMSVHAGNLDRLGATGLPVYITELDIDGPTDEIQLQDYQRIFPVFWEHPAVRGITLWGFRIGHWRTAQGAYLVLENGHERDAMVWLKEYVPNAVLPPWIEEHPVSKTVTVFDDVSFTCEGNGTAPLDYRWEKDGEPIEGNASASTAALTLEAVTAADAGLYTCVVSNGAGEAVSSPAELTVGAALSRHAPSLGGVLEGSIQMLLAENVSLAGGAAVSGDLLVPGTPQVALNGNPSYQGTVDGDGSPSPSGYTVTLSGGAKLRHVVRRTDPVSLPAVAAPPAPSGTRDVVLTSPGEDPGDFGTLRDLTLKDGAGQIAVPPGTYGSFSANTGSGFTLGVAGASEPAVYNLQSLTLKQGSELQVVGPIVLTVDTAAAVSGAAGSAGNPGWLMLNVASGGLTVNGATFHGFVLAPNGAVTINTGGTINGAVKGDQVVIREGASLIEP